MKQGGGEMKAYYVDNYFKFKTANGIVTGNFSLDPMEGRWHSFTLNIDYEARSLHIVFDKEEKTVKFGDKWLESLFVTSEEKEGNLVFVHGYNSLGGGCLKNVYVDHFSVLEMVKNGNKKAVSSKDIEFGECYIKASAASLLSMSLFMIAVRMLFNFL